MNTMQTTPDFDAIENERIETDIRSILGCLGAVAPFTQPGDVGVSGWTILDGAVSILRADMPVDFIVAAEDPCIAEHRRSILMTIRNAYTAGLGLSPGLNAEWVDVDGDFEMITNDGAMFAVITTTNEGAFFWSLASLSFCMPNGMEYGTCAQMRHAKRTVERIRRAYVSARS